MEPTLLSWSTPSSKSKKPMPLSRLHLFLPWSRYKHTFYCVSDCCVIQTHSVCLLTQINHWLRCILCAFAITSVDLHTLLIWFGLLHLWHVLHQALHVILLCGCPQQPGHILVFALYGGTLWWYCSCCVSCTS